MKPAIMVPDSQKIFDELYKLRSKLYEFGCRGGEEWNVKVWNAMFASEKFAVVGIIDYVSLYDAQKRGDQSM